MHHSLGNWLQRSVSPSTGAPSCCSLTQRQSQSPQRSNFRSPADGQYGSRNALNPDVLPDATGARIPPSLCGSRRQSRFSHAASAKSWGSSAARRDPPGPEFFNTSVMSTVNGVCSYPHGRLASWFIDPPHGRARRSTAPVEQHNLEQINSRSYPAVLVKPVPPMPLSADSGANGIGNCIGPLGNVTRLNASPLVVKCKLPRAVEINPVRAQLWTWICCLGQAKLVLLPSSAIFSFITIFKVCIQVIS